MIANNSTLAICRLVLLATLSSLATMGAAQAQTPSPAAVDLARQVILIKGGNNMFDPIVPGVIESAKNMFLPTNPGLAKDLNEVAAQLKKSTTQSGPNCSMRSPAPMRSDFRTRVERPRALLQNPFGQKVITEEPRALDAAMSRAQDWANNFSEEVINRMRAEMKKRGNNL